MCLVSWSIKHFIPASKLQHLAQTILNKLRLQNVSLHITTVLATIIKMEHVPCTWLEVTAEHNIQTHVTLNVC